MLSGDRPTTTAPVTFKCRVPGFWWAPGGWTILNDPTGPVGRPWKLLRHGLVVEWCHTLRIAKHRANHPEQTC